MNILRFKGINKKTNEIHNDFQFIKSGNSPNDWIMYTSDKQPATQRNIWENEPDTATNFKIIQSIGKYDKNGAEIFCDDILRKGKNLYRIVFDEKKLAYFLISTDGLKLNIPNDIHKYTISDKNDRYESIREKHIVKEKNRIIRTLIAGFVIGIVISMLTLITVLKLSY